MEEQKMSDSNSVCSFDPNPYCMLFVSTVVRKQLPCLSGTATAHAGSGASNCKFTFSLGMAWALQRGFNTEIKYICTSQFFWWISLKFALCSALVEVSAPPSQKCFEGCFVLSFAISGVKESMEFTQCWYRQWGWMIYMCFFIYPCSTDANWFVAQH